jgi:hypothetical protein
MKPHELESSDEHTGKWAVYLMSQRHAEFLPVEGPSRDVPQMVELEI